MSKFDRGVFIFIGLGIWALVVLHLFASNPLMANKIKSNHQHVPNDILQLEDFVWDVIPASCG